MKRVNIGSDKGLSPFRRQVIIITNTQSLSVGPLGTNVFEIVVKKIKVFNSRKYVWKLWNGGHFVQWGVQNKFMEHIEAVSKSSSAKFSTQWLLLSPICCEHYQWRVIVYTNTRYESLEAPPEHAITVTSHYRQGVSNHMQLHSLFNNKKHQNSTLLALVPGGFPILRATNSESASMYLSFRHREYIREYARHLSRTLCRFSVVCNC